MTLILPSLLLVRGLPPSPSSSLGSRCTSSFLGTRGTFQRLPGGAEGESGFGLKGKG